MVHVTQHAIDRYIERIEPTLSVDQARARIMASEGAIKVAADFGCRCVRTGIGAKSILVGDRVVTVIGQSWISADILKYVGERA